MDNVQAFDPCEVIAQNHAEYYEILFDTGNEVLQWTEEGFLEVAGKISMQMHLKEDVVVEAYKRAFSAACKLSKPGVLHLVPVEE